MPTALKILGQVNPAAATYVNLYTVPGSTTTVVSTLVICNRSATSATIRVAVEPSGAGSPVANEYYIYYDLIIPGNETFTSTMGMSLGAADEITVYTNNATVSFSAFGQEIT